VVLVLASVNSGQPSPQMVARAWTVLVRVPSTLPSIAPWLLMSAWVTV
jgi:hypothetical protein